MDNIDTTFLLGYVEQGLGGADPLLPPISVSKNGTLAKWRGNLDFLDLRVTDLGLKRFRHEYEDILKKTADLGIEVVMTLPEWVPLYYEMIPEAPPHILKREEEKERERAEAQGLDAVPEPRKRPSKSLNRVVFFKNCYLGLPKRLEEDVLYETLTVEDCIPIVELAAEYGVKHLVVPVGQPGIYLDPHGENAFKKAFKEINDLAKSLGIQCHIRNGGISQVTLNRLFKEFDCGYAYDVGIAQLECEDFYKAYRENSNKISILIVQQAVEGYNKWAEHKTNVLQALKNYIRAQKRYKETLTEEDEDEIEYTFRRYGYAFNDYNEARFNKYFNLGLFQNGDLNIIPLLKDVRRDVESGDTKYLLIEAVPNTKNNDMVMRTILPGIFTGTF